MKKFVFFFFSFEINSRYLQSPGLKQLALHASLRCCLKLIFSLLDDLNYGHPDEHYLGAWTVVSFIPVLACLQWPPLHSLNGHKTCPNCLRILLIMANQQTRSASKTPLGVTRFDLYCASYVCSLLTFLFVWRFLSRYTAVSRKVVPQNCAQQCQKVLWVVGVPGP